MFIERRINSSTGIIELWQAQWENVPGIPARKIYVDKVCDEQTAGHDADGGMSTTAAICWAYGRTLGNIAVVSPELLGHFPNQTGNDALLPCDFSHAGKFRHGADRLWCRTHQTHWGTKADIEALGQQGKMRCANFQQRMNYVVSPLSINVDNHAEVGIWCSMPAALSSSEIIPRPPRIHVHVRDNTDGKKQVDRDFEAISTLYSNDFGLYRNQEISRVNITPPAALDFVIGLELGKQIDCINCSHCGYPHLDLGDFAEKPHRKHFCGNCGRDSTWSKLPIVSTPLKPLHDKFAKTLKYETPNRSLNIDQFNGCSYTIWASTPAIVWSAARPQEFGIHVHVHDGDSRIVDDTFGEVVLNNALLERSDLVKEMLAKTII